MSNQENFRRFEYSLDEWAEKVRGRAVLFAKRVAFMVLGAYVLLPDGRLMAHSGVLQFTPVDTGRAVGNWMLSIGSPDLSVREEGFGTGGGAGVRAQAEREAQRRATAAISGFRIGQSIFLANSLPYIVVLNDGAKNRVAHHMMERALDNTKRALSAGGA